MCSTLSPGKVDVFVGMIELDGVLQELKAEGEKISVGGTSLHWGWVFQSWVKITQGCVKFEFRYESFKSKFTLNSFCL